MKEGLSASLVCGGLAGTAVDVSLYPLDTLKTRLQSQQGFWKAGGFRGVYSGLGAAALGSAPNAAAFFVTYDSVKRWLSPLVSENLAPVMHMGAATAGEVAACIVRVPVSIVVQRRQANQSSSGWNVVTQTLRTEGVRGMYRGYYSTLLREIPFSLLQFPLWEALKSACARWQGSDTKPWQGAVCGAIAGGVSAAATTPLDVAKTRIMLAAAGTEHSKGEVIPVIRDVLQERGIKGLFAGASLRTAWISLGGFIFFGVYEGSKALLVTYPR